MSATMFKAVVWKELRANLKWAVVVLVGMAVWIIYKMQLLLFDPNLLGVPDLNAVFNNLEGATAVGAILGGLLIGAAQALAENRGDKWGFLTHRPVSRSALFRGKATAGILLYAIATGLPVAVALFRMATPGYLPVPFDWRIALPVIANLLCGMVFYFAGFLTGMRQAHWYASRALGIGAAVACLGVQAAIATTLWQALAACATGLFIVGTAAWGTFVAGGQYGAQPRIGRIATGVSIGLGMAVVGGVALVIFPQVLHEYPVPQEFINSRHAVTTDGVFVRLTNERDRIVVSDLDGRPRDRYPPSAVNGSQGSGVLSVRLSPATQAVSFQSVRWLFTKLRAGDNAHPFTWHYVHRLGLIVAHDNRTRRLAGWLGPDGFSPYEARPRPFAGRVVRTRWMYSDQPQTLLVFEDAVYRVDMERRRVDKVFEPDPAETILDAGMSNADASVIESLGVKAPFAVIATTRRVIVQLRDGTRLLEAPLDAAALGYPDLQVSRALLAPGAPTFLWYERPVGEGHVSEFNGAGAIVNSRTLPSTLRARNEPLPQIIVASVATALVGQAFLEMVGGTGRGEPGSAATIRWTVGILSSLMFAVAAFARGRRYAFAPGRLRTWAGIALLLGPLGYLLMLALIERPALESCPACSRKRVVTREHCEHCGEAFATPPRDGTEIFESMPHRQA